MFCFSCYLTLLVLFCFYSHPFSCCVILSLSTLFLCGGLYCLFGFCWYICLFCIVSVGGIYILLLFVSISSPNSGLMSSGNVYYVIFYFLFFYFFLFEGGISMSLLDDYSFYLNSIGNRCGFVFLCIVLLVSLIMVSFICSSKDSFYR